MILYRPPNFSEKGKRRNSVEEARSFLSSLLFSLVPRLLSLSLDLPFLSSFLLSCGRKEESEGTTYVAGKGRKEGRREGTFYTGCVSVVFLPFYIPPSRRSFFFHSPFRATSYQKEEENEKRRKGEEEGLQKKDLFRHAFTRVFCYTRVFSSSYTSLIVFFSWL